ncbi:Rne/Rng family ribonuclease [Pseudophaeobacter arcticus]|uniref:Rne/Rng family ribonuclease n=1 Tax=Pseudophaeobacter arcticus TaxID=385492 RepID=UPI00249190C5|nr:ribonuclease E/G [Pseudophaeobacter arcticus]
MAKKMLIDATHAEETRVVVVDGNKVEEFDFESENKRQLAGNIYLAKVTRVEPSLQAAFVEYGGNRHGFLAFSEIHPDYYQIPVADREALMEEERAYAEAQRAREEDDEAKPSRSRSRSRKSSRSKAAKVSSGDAVETKEVAPATSAAETGADTPAVVEIAGMETIDLVEEMARDEAKLAEVPEGSSPMERVADTPVEEPSSPEEASQDAAGETATAEAPEQEATDQGTAAQAAAEPTAEATAEADTDKEASDETGENGAQAEARADASSKDESIESVADEDDSEDIRPARKPRPRRYKIQEVIKVRQILLVQVVKEERGNKGAALTTYLSLAGRYCVLMPNTARGGGISRKITNAVDRKKLKDIATEIDVPSGAGLIVRTAGAKRTKAEIKRDYEYLQRLWEQIRELTLKSIAPAKIYEEGDLIKRSIRDLYNREIDEVLVEGERGYRIAKDFMKMIMPSHAKNVKNYQETLPLFARFQVESYLGGMFNPTVQLKSGGYIVIDTTEALVAVDVNSGRATKQSSIEETALNTNLEAAEEVARQLRLRDLAGLIVIDFIDMDERKNNAAVENRMKDKLKTDRARIQVGRISGFGLMEMSRQRLRPGMIEATTAPCPHCHGTGLIRSDDSMALSILRQIEEEGTRRRSREVLVRCPIDIANYLMNQKREHIAQIEARYGMSVRIEGDAHLVSPDFTLEKFKTATRVVSVPEAPVVSADTSLMAQIDADEAEAEADAEVAEEEQPREAVTESEETETSGEDKPKRKRRRRRRRKSGNGGENYDSDSNGTEAGDSSEAGSEGETKPDSEAGEEAESEEKKPTRTRTRTRGGRSRSKKSEETTAEATQSAEAPAAEAGDTASVAAETTPVSEAETSSKNEAEAVAAPASEKAAPAEGTVTEDAVSEPEVSEPAVSETAASEAPAEDVVAKAAAEPQPAEATAPEVDEAAAAEVSGEDPPAAEPAEQEPVAETVAAPDVTAQPEVTETPAAEAAPEPAAPAEVEVVAEPEPSAPPKPKRRGWWSIG